MEAARHLRGAPGSWMQCVDPRGRNAWHLAALGSHASTLRGTHEKLFERTSVEKPFVKR